MYLHLLQVIALQIFHCHLSCRNQCEHLKQELIFFLRGVGYENRVRCVRQWGAQDSKTCLLFERWFNTFSIKIYHGKFNVLLRHLQITCRISNILPPWVVFLIHKGKELKKKCFKIMYLLLTRCWALTVLPCGFYIML